MRYFRRCSDGALRAAGSVGPVRTPRRRRVCGRVWIRVRVRRGGDDGHRRRWDGCRYGPVCELPGARGTLARPGAPARRGSQRLAVGAHAETPIHVRLTPARRTRPAPPDVALARCGAHDARRVRHRHIRSPFVLPILGRLRRHRIPPKCHRQRHRPNAKRHPPPPARGPRSPHRTHWARARRLRAPRRRCAARRRWRACALRGAPPRAV